MDANALVREAAALVAAELRTAGVRVAFDLAEPMPPAMADAVQVQQVLVNLIRNAADAMRGTEAAGRRVMLRTEVCCGAFARVSVIDAGRGIPPELRSQVFEAFFTTKPDGLGMGLTISRSIIESHGGELGFTPNAGPGLTVHFTLPLAEGEKGGEP